jgi:hypothetical protein
MIAPLFLWFKSNRSSGKSSTELSIQSGTEYLSSTTETLKLLHLNSFCAEYFVKRLFYFYIFQAAYISIVHKLQKNHKRNVDKR